jgi:hypothetical protein
MKSNSFAILGASTLYAKVFREYLQAHPLPGVNSHLYGDEETLLTASADSADCIQPERPEEMQDYPLLLDFKSGRKTPLTAPWARILHCGACPPPPEAVPVHASYGSTTLPASRPAASPHPAVCVLLRLLRGICLDGVLHAHAVLLLSTSEEGQDGHDELFNQTLALMNAQVARPKIYKEQISFNLVPELDPALPKRLGRELDAFLPAGLFRLSHVVRAGAFFGSLIALDLSFHDPSAHASVLTALREHPFLKWETKRHHGLIKAALEDRIPIAVAHDAEHDLQLWIATDALRTGMAWNLAGLVEQFFQHYQSN